MVTTEQTKLRERPKRPQADPQDAALDVAASLGVISTKVDELREALRGISGWLGKATRDLSDFDATLETAKALNGALVEADWSLPDNVIEFPKDAA